MFNVDNDDFDVEKFLDEHDHHEVYCQSLRCVDAPSGHVISSSESEWRESSAGEPRIWIDAQFVDMWSCEVMK
jgi:hypothetical protein